MRILLVTETLHAGGAEIFVLRLCRKLNKLGYSCDILNLNPDIENNALLKQFQDLTIHRIDLPFLRIIKKLDGFFYRIRIDISLQHSLSQKWIKRKIIGSYDVYHTHLIKVDYLFSKIKEQHPNLKLIATVHGDYSDLYYKVENFENVRWLNFRSKLELVKLQINKWVVISEEQRQFLKIVLQLPAAKLSKFYNGYEAALPSTGSEANKKDFIIGMVARGVEQKGWRILIKSFLDMPQNCQLRLVGAGEYLDKLKNKYADNPRIIFTGFHSNPIEEIVKFDVFVLPSLFPYESLPTVIIEALFCGKPVIATKVGEIPEMIVEPYTGSQAGFLLDFDGKEVSAQQLYNFLMRYYLDKNLIKEHSAVALKAFEKFDMNTCVHNYLEVYKSL